MPARKRTTRSRHVNALSLLKHDYDDLAGRFSYQETMLSDVLETLKKHRKEEKDNGKRIDALEKRVAKLPTAADIRSIIRAELGNK